MNWELVKHTPSHFSLEIDVAYIYILFFKDKLILNVPRVINMLSGHPLQPGKAQPRRIQKVTDDMLIKK